MSARTKILAILSLPAGVAGYLVTGAILSALSLPEGLAGGLMLFLPLLVAGLCMAPFLVPFFDQMARRDLAAIQEQRAATEDAKPDEPEGPTKSPSG